MVGHPKTVDELAKIKAGVKVTCLACKRERLLNRDRLIADLTRRGHSTSWEGLRGRLRCACGSKQVDVLAMPFTDGEEDGEALFEALLRAYDRSAVALSKGSGNGADCREMAESSKELHSAKVAMRAWIVARAKPEVRL